MSSVYQFNEFMISARKALEEGNADIAMDWVNRAFSLSKHLDEEAIAGAYELKARILVAEEEYGEAEEAVQKSLDMFRGNTEGHVLLAELMILDGRHEEAELALRLALEVAPESVRAVSLLIFCCSQSGQYDAARECFERCVGLDPDFADGYYHMGICFVREGKAEARSFFEKALSKDPVMSGPHYYLGLMEVAKGDFGAAEGALRMELELNPANSLAEFQLIRSYLLSVPWGEAVELFDRHFPPECFCDIPLLRNCRFHFNYHVLNEKFLPFLEAVMGELPQTPENLFRVARIYRYRSLFGEAVEILKKVIGMERNFRPGHEELADVYRAQDELARACEVLEGAAEIFGDVGAYCELGKALISSGRYAEAQDAVRKAVSLGPDRAEPHYLLGVILAEVAGRGIGSEGLMEEARKCLRSALEIDPCYSAARTYLMHVAFQGGEYGECLQMAEKALSENPDDRMALWYSGRCFHASGELARAEERFGRLIEAYPDDQGGRAAIAEVYRAQGKFKEAVEELEQATAIPGRRPPPDLLFRLGEIHLMDLNEPGKAREYFSRFLQVAPAGHPDFDRARRFLGGASLE